MTITLIHREAARDIIHELRKHHSRGEIAEFIGICPAYVSFAVSMSQRTRGYPEEFICPKKAIGKILDYAVKSALVGSK